MRELLNHIHGITLSSTDNESMHKMFLLDTWDWDEQFEYIHRSQSLDANKRQERVQSVVEYSSQQADNIIAIIGATRSPLQPPEQKLNRNLILAVTSDLGNHGVPCWDDVVSTVEGRTSSILSTARRREAKVHVALARRLEQAEAVNANEIDWNSWANYLKRINSLVRGRNRPASWKRRPHGCKYIRYAEPESVEHETKELYQLVRDIEHPIVRAYTMYAGLNLIHPFEDGNGRTARALLNSMLIDAQSHPLVWLVKQKVLIMRGMQRLAGENNPMPLVAALTYAIEQAAQLPYSDREELGRVVAAQGGFEPLYANHQQTPENPHRR